MKPYKYDEKEFIRLMLSDRAIDHALAHLMMSLHVHEIIRLQPKRNWQDIDGEIKSVGSYGYDAEQQKIWDNFYAN